MQYNEKQYNESSYNFSLIAAALAETVATTDVLTKMPMMVRTDSQAAVDALGNGTTLAALLDSVIFQHRARYYSTPYGAFSYNEAMYNVIEDDDEVLLMPIKALSDSMASSDDLATLWAAARILAETQPLVDATLVFVIQPIFAEFLFLSEFFRIEVTNKALNDELRMADWVQLERNPANNGWYD